MDQCGNNKSTLYLVFAQTAEGNHREICFASLNWSPFVKTNKQDLDYFVLISFPNGGSKIRQMSLSFKVI